MKLDRELQLSILNALAHVYPTGLINLSQRFNDVAIDKLYANIIYLAEHNLLKSGVKQVEFIGHQPSFGESGLTQITAIGLDFLQDDGGVGAILKTVTIKLHSDTIKDLLKQKVDASDAPKPEKDRLKKMIDTMTTETAKNLAKQLVEKGVAQLPNAIEWLSTIFHP